MNLLMNPWVNLLLMLLLVIAVIGFATFLYSRFTHLVRCPQCGEEERISRELTEYHCPKCGSNVLEGDKNSS